ncbi:hypothetical protein FH972_023018 [Carpinus fangiana]|uniref:Autophagy-related protein 9 n=1 Tax=Carpinus fangiana TaxID=176857 RepID=A0A5N6KTY7_9ROSI|nr:hypothetical protein FH972_023018 [Carpinus fangiana]
MASNILSRILPPANGGQSIYEAIRDQEQAAATSTSEADAQHEDVDEQNLEERFRDEDMDLLAEAMGSRLNSQSPEITDHPPRSRRSSTGPATQDSSVPRPKWLRNTTRAQQYRDDDVSPEMLLLEDTEAKKTDPNRPVPSRQASLPPPVPGPSTRKTRVQWDTTREQQRLYDDDRARESPAYRPTSALQFADPADKAMWRWTNVENLDNFFKDVYVYYIEKGIWSILLRRVIGMFTAAFVVSLTVFLSSCIDYSLIPTSHRLPDVLVPKCTKNMSALNNLLVWLFSFFWIIKLVSYATDMRRLWHLHDFYTHLLHIPDVEIQTISWQEIVGRIMNLRDANPRTALNINRRSRKFIGDVAKESMDAHDIANRLMRKENYYIALFNKDILDCTIPLPGLRDRRLFSKALEWNLGYCVSDFVFNDQGQVKQIFLKDTHRQALIDSLRTRFIVAGFINIVVAPIVVVSILVLYFLRYFTEFQRDPSQAGARGYTPFAEWKFREFNELHHLFQRRLNMSYPFASRYLDQFPKDKTVQLARFVRTIAGALATVLAVASLLDPEVFLGFEITPDRTVLFWLGILATIWATARGMVPDDELVFDPEYAINEVAQYTHYHPVHWHGRLHSDEVRQEFSELYRNKIRIFLEEILGIIVTPFVLWFSLPQCSEQIVDFFREFTVHVDGLGYVCWFAHFNFRKPGQCTAHLSTRRPLGLRNHLHHSS